MYFRQQLQDVYAMLFDGATTELVIFFGGLLLTILFEVIQVNMCYVS